MVCNLSQTVCDWLKLMTRVILLKASLRLKNILSFIKLILISRKLLVILKIWYLMYSTSITGCSSLICVFVGHSTRAIHCFISFFFTLSIYLRSFTWSKSFFSLSCMEFIIIVVAEWGVHHVFFTFICWLLNWISILFDDWFFELLTLLWLISRLISFNILSYLNFKCTSCFLTKTIPDCKFFSYNPWIITS